MISHPDKILFPADGITKGELAAYYESVARLMLPHIAGRPVTMERYPAGIGETGFMHKSVTRGVPPWLERVEVPKKKGTVHHPLVGDVRSLLWIANQNCITPHVWTSRVPDLFHPDVCVFDLDPSREDDEALRGAALRLRAILGELGLDCRVKTSGSKGFHILVPLASGHGFGDVMRFAHGVSRRLIQEAPDLLTDEFAKADRGSRILIDIGRNGYSATVAAAYAVRARSGAPVSAPCTWEEIEAGRVAPRSFTLRNMEARVSTAGDLWPTMPAQVLPRDVGR